MKKLTAFLILLALTISTVCAAVSSEMVQPRYVRVRNARASLSISGTSSYSSGHVQLTNSTDHASVVTELYSDENGGWQVVCSWVNRGNGAVDITAGGDRAVKSGCSYQVVMTASVYDSSGKLVEKAVERSATKRA